MSEKHAKVLASIDKRLAILEERTIDIPTIRESIIGLKVRMAGIAATIAVIVSLAVARMSKDPQPVAARQPSPASYSQSMPSR